MNGTKKITWDSSFSVGVALLDKQHRVITEVINELTNHAHAAVGSEKISDVLDKLTHYASLHFKTEEAILEQHGYLGRAEQIREHHAYRIKIATLCQETVFHKSSVSTDLIQFLRDWWVDHILVSDMQYRAFLAERVTV